MNVTRIGIGLVCIGLHYVLKKIGGIPGLLKNMISRALLFLGILLVISGFV
jgi:hypothetical protein